MFTFCFFFKCKISQSKGKNYVKFVFPILGKFIPHDVVHYLEN